MKVRAKKANRVPGYLKKKEEPAAPRKVVKFAVDDSEQNKDILEKKDDNDD